jgi:hypothetical protein
MESGSQSACRRGGLDYKEYSIGRRRWTGLILCKGKGQVAYEVDRSAEVLTEIQSAAGSANSYYVNIPVGVLIELYNPLPGELIWTETPGSEHVFAPSTFQAWSNPWLKHRGENCSASDDQVTVPGVQDGVNAPANIDELRKALLFKQLYCSEVRELVAWIASPGLGAPAAI